ncbi:MAG: hypothetical protein IPL59_08680 [Candidatus Competibacteraceae bacterium]|nr:hypothetical protein [Candidatus Competibacteraceae bacterium]MBK8755494.1 hypothetical protein [Candidatus Competibacteraceae bacterium]
MPNLVTHAYTLPNAYALEDWLYKQQQIRAYLQDVEEAKQMERLTDSAWSFAEVIEYVDGKYPVSDNPLTEMLFAIYLGTGSDENIRALLINETEELAKKNARKEKTQ